MLINIPMFLHMADISMDEIDYDYLLINVHDPDDHALIN